MPAFLSRFFSPPAPPLAGLWRTITETAREPRWYLDHGVADTIDGRFDMVALVSSLVMLSLERRGKVAETATLTERFVEDMDGSLRDIGIGDMVVGKHVGRMMGAMGGRLTAYREAMAAGADPAALPEALARNVYRQQTADDAANGLADAARALHARIEALPDAALLKGAWT